MSEKLKTFIIDSVGDFIINSRGKINLIAKQENEMYMVQVEEGYKLLFTKNELIKLFNLDLEVKDEN